MKKITILIILLAAPLYSADIRPIPEDAFIDQEAAKEAAVVINQNFQELINSKVNGSSPSITTPKYIVIDLLDPENEESNAFFIMENADDIWREKVDLGGVNSTDGRTVQLDDLLDPSNAEENVARINQLFYELDYSKAEK